MSVNNMDHALMYLKLGITFYVLNQMLSQSVSLYKLTVYSFAVTVCVLGLMSLLRVELLTFESGGRIGLLGEGLNAAAQRWAAVAVGMTAYLVAARRIGRLATLSAAGMIGISVLSAFRTGKQRSKRRDPGRPGGACGMHA